jgi:hypothetical protein
LCAYSSLFSQLQKVQAADLRQPAANLAILSAQLRKSDQQLFPRCQQIDVKRHVKIFTRAFWVNGVNMNEV